MPAVTVDHFEDVMPLGAETIWDQLRRVWKEIGRQDDLAREGKFAGTHILPSGPDHARLGVVMEEAGEVARECNELLMGRGDRAHLHEELVQLAACAVAWAAAIEEGR